MLESEIEKKVENEIEKKVERKAEKKGIIRAVAVASG